MLLGGKCGNLSAAGLVCCLLCIYRVAKNHGLLQIAGKSCTACLRERILGLLTSFLLFLSSCDWGNGAGRNGRAGDRLNGMGAGFSCLELLAGQGSFLRGGDRWTGGLRRSSRSRLLESLLGVGSPPC